MSTRCSLFLSGDVHIYFDVLEIKFFVDHGSRFHEIDPEEIRDFLKRAPEYLKWYEQEALKNLKE